MTLCSMSLDLIEHEVNGQLGRNAPTPHDNQMKGVEGS